MVLNANGIRMYPTQNRTESPCFAWDIALIYDFNTLAEVEVRLDAQPRICDQNVAILFISCTNSVFMTIDPS